MFLGMVLLAKKVAVVDDDQNMGLLVKDILESEGLEVRVYTSAKVALSEMNNFTPDVLITDLKMKEMDGMALLKATKDDHPSIVTVMMTAFGSIETAIEAMKNGAYHYLVKPFKNDELLMVTRRALERSALRRENYVLKSELKRNTQIDSLIGKSPKMIELFELIKRASKANANILIQGESGSGRERVARAIHNLGPRSDKNFCVANCSSIPEKLLETELFGCADSDKKGLILEAHDGSLYLDEVADLSPNLQAKILRVLQDKKVSPVDRNESQPVNVRIISATHKDLNTLIAEEKFREDLYYRINVVPVNVPALRERKEDIPQLAHYFLAKFAVANESPVKTISKEAMAALMSHPWPGNVRELESIIERAVVLSQHEELQNSDIMGIALDKAQKDIDQLYVDRPTLDKLEERYIRLILGEANNQKEKASNILGISRRTLYRKERTYGLVDINSPEPGQS